MRTTLDLPDELDREPKVRTAMEGIPLKALVSRLLRGALAGRPQGKRPRGRRDRPPVALAPTGRAIPVLTKEELRRLEEDEALSIHARSS